GNGEPLGGPGRPTGRTRRRLRTIGLRRTAASRTATADHPIETPVPPHRRTQPNGGPMSTAIQDDVVTELTAWLEDNWDPELTVGEWWERLGLAGWAAPNLPANAYGRDLSRNDTVRVQETIAGFGALGEIGRAHV